MVRGDTGAREFIAFWLHDGQVVAAMNVNTWDVAEPIRALVSSGARVDVTRLADREVSLPQVAVR